MKNNNTTIKQFRHFNHRTFYSTDDNGFQISSFFSAEHRLWVGIWETQLVFVPLGSSARSVGVSWVVRSYTQTLLSDRFQHRRGRRLSFHLCNGQSLQTEPVWSPRTLLLILSGLFLKDAAVLSRLVCFVINQFNRNWCEINLQVGYKVHWLSSIWSKTFLVSFDSIKSFTNKQRS